MTGGGGGGGGGGGVGGQRKVISASPQLVNLTNRLVAACLAQHTRGESGPEEKQQVA